jgi:hypothetical protein
MVVENIAIDITTNRKPSWRLISEALKNNGTPLDLRKKPKGAIPLEIELDCYKCGINTLNIYKVKDFPLKNKKCKCGKSYLVKWNKLKI